MRSLFSKFSIIDCQQGNEDQQSFFICKGYWEPSILRFWDHSRIRTIVLDRQTNETEEVVGFNSGGSTLCEHDVSAFEIYYTHKENDYGLSYIDVRNRLILNTVCFTCTGKTYRQIKRQKPFLPRQVTVS